MAAPRILMGWAAIPQLCKALGITANDTQRIIIDIEVGEPVKVYVEKVGAEKALKFMKAAVAGAKVQVLEPGTADVSSSPAGHLPYQNV